MNSPQEIVTRLYESGMTDQAIAKAVKSHQPVIWRIRNGHQKDCMASVYLRLVELAKEKSPA